MAERTGIAVHLRTREIESAGVKLDTPIAMSLTNQTISKALGAIVQSLAPNGGITYWSGGNVVEIGTLTAERQSFITRVYDVQDILNNPTEHGVPEIWQVTDDPPDEGLLEYIEMHIAPSTRENKRDAN